MVINIGIVEDKESELENIKRTFYSFIKKIVIFKIISLMNIGKRRIS